MKKIHLNVEMQDGTIHENLRVVNKDMTRAEEIAHRFKWGSFEESPFRYSTFMAFCAMTRLGHFDINRGFDAFEDEIVAVEHSEDGEDVNPTL